LLETGEGDCRLNMAVDEALFQAYDSAVSLPVLRIYGWNPPALSIGLFQNPLEELDLVECRRRNIDFVRRMSGGGIIFHDKELTYSIVCSESDIQKACFAKEIYKYLCVFLIEAYRAMGLAAGFSLSSNKAPRSGWVCFQGREKYDIVIGGKKIGGNAQRRRRGLIFQHGSIPLYTRPGWLAGLLRGRLPDDCGSPYSLSQAAGRDITSEELKGYLIESFQKSFSARLIRDTLNPAEDGLRGQLLTRKYETDRWNLHADSNPDKAFVAQ